MLVEADDWDMFLLLLRGDARVRPWTACRRGPMEEDADEVDLGLMTGEDAVLNCSSSPVGTVWSWSCVLVALDLPRSFRDRSRREAARELRDMVEEEAGEMIGEV